VERAFRRQKMEPRPDTSLLSAVPDPTSRPLTRSRTRAEADLPSDGSREVVEPRARAWRAPWQWPRASSLLRASASRRRTEHNCSRPRRKRGEGATPKAFYEAPPRVSARPCPSRRARAASPPHPRPAAPPRHAPSHASSAPRDTAPCETAAAG